MDGAVAGDTGIPLIAQLDPKRFDSAGILKQVAAASRQLAELKGITVGIPNREVLINTLGLQEAKDSSAIENIVTTHDQLFREASLPEAERSAAGKEVLRYVLALRLGHARWRGAGCSPLMTSFGFRGRWKLNQAGFRKLPVHHSDQERILPVWCAPYATLMRGRNGSSTCSARSRSRLERALSPSRRFGRR